MELSKLNPDKAYIQITFAEPYFDNYGEYNHGSIAVGVISIRRSYKELESLD